MLFSTNSFILDRQKKIADTDIFKFANDQNANLQRNGHLKQSIYSKSTKSLPQDTDTFSSFPVIQINK